MIDVTRPGVAKTMVYTQNALPNRILEIKDFVMSFFASAPEEKVVESDPDFIYAKKLAWAFLAYEKIFNLNLSASPGPGNGYFDTAQALFEQIEMISRRLKLSDSIDRSPYYPFIEKLFPGAPALTRTLYPAILFFVARRMKENKKIEGSDYWFIFVNPSKKMQVAAELLLSATQNLLGGLRYGDEGTFKETFTLFEKYWSGFYKMLGDEDPHSLCPDLEIQSNLILLVNDPLYLKNKEKAKKLASYFESDQNKVITSLEKYPKRLEDNYKNNRAYNHARLLTQHASKNIVFYGDLSAYEIVILT